MMTMLKSWQHSSSSLLFRHLQSLSDIDKNCSIRRRAKKNFSPSWRVLYIYKFCNFFMRRSTTIKNLKKYFPYNCPSIENLPLKSFLDVTRFIYLSCNFYFHFTLVHSILDFLFRRYYFQTFPSRLK